MFNIGQFTSYVNENIGSIAYPDTPDSLFEPVRYMLQGGGKRIRPVLTLASCAALGGAYSDAINQALGIEMFHNFTLLHDDVMDNSDTRHGRPTVHRRWDESTAILSGDAMLTMASQLIMRCAGVHTEEALGIFNSVAMDVYRGQQYDMDFEARTNVSIGEYLEMIRLKTGVLIGGACRIGALMADADKEACDAMYAYGEALGLAFQLQDDYLDTYGNPEVFGKPIGGDIINGKKTWLLLSAMEGDPDAVSQAMSYGGQQRIDAVKEVYSRLSLPQRCRELIDGYTNRAIGAVMGVAMDSSSRAVFIDLAHKAAVRDK
ncbi:MAG TPA: polyprenyl synthetase family protein [Muribaculaceae bacterium]|nr:polyprenyl synthetase family protein [Muribaculaceae bacterium]